MFVCCVSLFISLFVFNFFLRKEREDALASVDKSLASGGQWSERFQLCLEVIFFISTLYLSSLIPPNIIFTEVTEFG